MTHIIPPLDSPYSWTQPDRKNILVGDDTAIMTQFDFKLLSEYSNSTPSGKYPGKMWRLHASDRQDYLCWYALVPGRDDRIAVHTRKIVIGDWQALFGAKAEEPKTATSIMANAWGVQVKHPGLAVNLTTP